jgi:hypothetical protein
MNQLITCLGDLGLTVFGGYAYAKMGLRSSLSVFFVVSLIGALLILFIGE